MLGQRIRNPRSERQAACAVDSKQFGRPQQRHHLQHRARSRQRCRPSALGLLGHLELVGGDRAILDNPRDHAIRLIGPLSLNQHAESNCVGRVRRRGRGTAVQEREEVRLTATARDAREGERARRGAACCILPRLVSAPTDTHKDVDRRFAGVVVEDTIGPSELCEGHRLQREPVAHIRDHAAAVELATNDSSRRGGGLLFRVGSSVSFVHALLEPINGAIIATVPLPRSARRVAVRVECPEPVHLDPAGRQRHLCLRPHLAVVLADHEETRGALDLARRVGSDVRHGNDDVAHKVPRDAPLAEVAHGGRVKRGSRTSL
eukprot:7385408-Prymnesium_polylepis.1